MMNRLEVKRKGENGKGGKWKRENMRNVEQDRDDESARRREKNRNRGA